MVKTRHEFGFDEPHPRWCRVPVQESLEYATRILEQVVIPLHKHSKSTILQKQTNNDDIPKAKTYESMVQLYREAWQDMKKQQASYYDSLKEQQKQHQHDDDDIRMSEALELLETAVTTIL
jgi:hypothetical protein